MARGRLSTPKLYEFFKGTARHTGEHLGRFPVIVATGNRRVAGRPVVSPYARAAPERERGLREIVKYDVGNSISWMYLIPFVNCESIN